METKILDRIGERVDRLITLDIRGRGAKCPIMEKLYPAARELYGRPITAFAADKLCETINKGDCVFIVTGLACFGMSLETDGPPGAVSLARALQMGLGANPVFITHHLFTHMLAETAIGGGFLIFSPKDIRQAWSKMPSAALVAGFPTDDIEAEKMAKDLIKEYKPKAIIAIEARGPNEEGVYHVVNGTDITSKEAKMDHLFKKEAKDDHILTIGILDGCGHEIGFGTISSAVIDEYGRYSSCECGCKSGMHDATHVDIVIPAATSNWGAYGIEACLSALLERKEVLHNKELESRMLRICADAGAIDGLTARSEFSVDGLSETIQISIVEILGEIVQSTLKGYEPDSKSN